MAQLHQYLHRRVLIQILIIALVALFLAVAVVLDAIAGAIGFVPIAIAAVIGIAAGYLMGRMFLLTWHEDTQKVIIQMDKMSFVLIALYIAFRVFGTQLLGDYFNGTALSAISFALLDGILIGRLISMWRNISRILTEQGIVGT